ncbi:hypothetical protein [Parvibaculum sp.]|uniref:hypothetical protein n=1 Tax=Parvibaculum sp. TaxID=2024848 RepID=UPI00320EB7A1
MRVAAPLLCIALTLSACAQSTPPQPQVTLKKPEPLVHIPVDDRGSGIVGPGGGALLGTVIGAGHGAEIAVIAGLAIGYAVGGSNGPTLSGFPASEQRRAMARVMQVPVGETVRWWTATEQASGTIRPTREYTDKDGRRCRDFTETRTVRATHGLFSGTACL